MSEFILKEVLCWVIILLIGILAYFIREKFKDLSKKDDTLDGNLKDLKFDFKDFTKEMREIINRHDNDIKDLRIKVFGFYSSPFRLKDEWKKPILQSDLQKQIENKLPKFIEEIQNKHFPAPLEAQNYILYKYTEEVLSQFDLRDFNIKLYEAGGLSGDVSPIISIYLQELIIPKLNFKI